MSSPVSLLQLEIKREKVARIPPSLMWSNGLHSRPSTSQSAIAIETQMQALRLRAMKTRPSFLMRPMDSLYPLEQRKMYKALFNEEL